VTAKLEDREFLHFAATKVFLDIVSIYLPGDRSQLRLSDSDALRLLMRVIYTGASHCEAATGVCEETELIERHHEYARAGALAEFLYQWPQMHHRLLAQEPV
jgi:hypothetical protein